MFKLNMRPWPPLAKGRGKEIVAIELGASTLKIVRVSAGLNQIDLLNVWSRNISGTTDEEISKLIRSAFLDMKLKETSVVNILPTNLVITKNIEIPSTSPKEIRDIISLQAGRHTPYSKEEIIVDYIDIGVFKNNYTKIWLVIVARSAIKRQQELLEKAGLRFEHAALVAEGIAHASSRILKLETQNAPAAIVHLDETTTDFIVVFKARPVFARSIPMGSAHLLDARDVYETKFLDELKRSLEAYQNEDIDKTPGSLILTGAIAPLAGLAESLDNSLHLTVKGVPYLSGVNVAESCLKEMNNASRTSFFGCLASLAFLDKARVNLIPEEIKMRKALEERGKELIKTGILVLSIAVLTFSVILTNIYFKGAYLKRLDQKFFALDKDARDLEKNFTLVNSVKNYLIARGYSLEVLTELYDIVSEDLQLSDIRFDETGKFSVKGTAEAMSSVFEFVEKMEKSVYFKDAKNRYTTKRKEGLKDVTDFEIVCTLVKTP